MLMLVQTHVLLFDSHKHIHDIFSVLIRLNSLSESYNPLWPMRQKRKHKKEKDSN